MDIYIKYSFECIMYSQSPSWVQILLQVHNFQYTLVQSNKSCKDELWEKIIKNGVSSITEDPSAQD